ncbi:MAG TPA: nucleotidyltransferase family protein [Terriglobia bacterium]|nr:nucleotidyltransferase family protein [Terriglobia bacterium]
MTRTRDQVLRTLEENREAIRRFGVRTLGLFGSVVRGESTASSDLDFVVEFDRNTFDAYMGLKEFLEELFDCPVDLVLAHTLKPRLRDPVLREAVHAPRLFGLELLRSAEKWHCSE